MGRCSHLSNCLQEKKNPERENWVTDDLFSDSIDSIIVIFILFLPFLWCSVKLSSLSVSFHFFFFYTITKKKLKKSSFFYSTKSVALYFLPLLLNLFGSQFFVLFFPSLPLLPSFFLFVFAIMISSTHYGFACQVLHALHHRGLSISHMEKT